MAEPDQVPVTERLQIAEAALERLAREVDDLRREIRWARGQIDLSMKGQTRCPACGGRKILHATEVLDRGDGDFRQKMALAKPSIWRSRVVGQFQVYICAACGLVEWYAPNLEGLEVDGKVFQMLDGGADPQGGPYR
jgi:DNA-directed RNA polymerase subunit RPC12/RpoP